MKGKLIKRDNNWYITHIMDDNGVKFGVDYPLSLDDVNQIEADAQIFDNIEARISAHPDCEFEIITIDNGDNGVRYAKLKQSEYPELEGTMNLCNNVIEKRTGKMTEEEWVAAENNLKPKYTPSKGISFYITNEISDEEIKEAAKDYHRNNGVYYGQEKTFIDAIKWYREQLKSKQ